MIAKFSIKGLEELQSSIEPAKIRKQLEIGAGQAIQQIHSELRLAMQRVYKTPFDLNSVLVGKSTSAQTRGKNLIQGKLGYELKPIHLAQYMDAPPYKGNIPPLPKKREGFVHTVEIIRGRKRIVYGEKGLGGFTPRKSNGSLVRINGRAIMMERDSKAKYPTHTLYGPSLAVLALHLYETDKKVQEVKEKIPFILLESIKL